MDNHTTTKTDTVQNTHDNDPSTWKLVVKRKKQTQPVNTNMPDIQNNNSTQSTGKDNSTQSTRKGSSSSKRIECKTQ
jgi:hypothetical protein